MNKLMSLMLVASMSTASMLAHDSALTTCNDEAMEQIEKETMARLEEELKKQAPGSRLLEAMQTNATKKKLAAQIIAGVLAVGGVVAFAYWLLHETKEQTPPPGGSNLAGDNHDESGCSDDHHTPTALGFDDEIFQQRVTRAKAKREKIALWTGISH